MRGAGFAVAMTFAAMAGCGLATSGLMEAGPASTLGLDAGTHPSSLGDAALSSGGNEDASSSSDAGDDDATLGTGTPDGAVDTGSQATPDACSLPNDGGPIFAIAAWPGPPPPMIDGNLSEWPCTGYVDFANANAAYVKTPSYALGADVQVRWDAMNLYVAARITDATVGGDDDTDPYNNDSVEVYVSGDPTLDGDYDTTTHQYITDWKGLIVDYGPSHAGGLADTVHAHFTAAAATIPGGWAFEAAIGWQALYAGGNNKFASGANVALDFEVNDGDGTQQVAAIVLTMAPTSSQACTCTDTNCCCGMTPDVPSCDSQRITRVTLQ